MTTKTITIEPRQSYGQTRYYPVCDFATLVCKLADTKTVTAAMLLILSRAGYRIDTASGRDTFVSDLNADLRTQT